MANPDYLYFSSGFLPWSGRRVAECSIFSGCLGIVAFFAGCLVILRVPEEFVVAAVGLDVVDDGGGGYDGGLLLQTV